MDAPVQRRQPLPQGLGCRSPSLQCRLSHGGRHTAIGLVHLSMKAFGTLSPAEGDYTSRLALSGPVPASHSGLVFHFPSSILGSSWVQPHLAISDASFFTLLLIRSTPFQHAPSKPPQSKLSQSPDACSSLVPLYCLHRFLAHLIQLSAHISPSR